MANHQTRLPRATSSLALNASRDGASTTSLGNLFQCVTTLYEQLPPDIQPKPPLCQFKTIPPCPISIHPCKQLFPLQPVQVPLDVFLSFQCINCTTQLGVICKPAEGALDAIYLDAASVAAVVS